MPSPPRQTKPSLPAGRATLPVRIVCLALLLALVALALRIASDLVRRATAVSRLFIYRR